MESVYLCYQFGDFDAHIVIGVAEDLDAAGRLIKADYKEDQLSWNKKPKKLIDNGDGTYKKPDENDGEDHHFWTRKVKMNKAF